MVKLLWFTVAEPGHTANNLVFTCVNLTTSCNLCMRKKSGREMFISRSSVRNITKSFNVSWLLFRLKSLMLRRMLLAMTCLKLEELSVRVGPRCDCRPVWTPWCLPHRAAHLISDFCVTSQSSLTNCSANYHPTVCVWEIKWNIQEVHTQHMDPIWMSLFLPHMIQQSYRNF